MVVFTYLIIIVIWQHHLLMLQHNYPVPNFDKSTGDARVYLVKQSTLFRFDFFFLLSICLAYSDGKRTLGFTLPRAIF